MSRPDPAFAATAWWARSGSQGDNAGLSGAEAARRLVEHGPNRVDTAPGHSLPRELLRRLADGERFGQRQLHKGRLYQVKQRGLRHEREVDRRLRQGLLRQLDLDARVTWFPAQAAVEPRAASVACSAAVP